MDKANYVVSLDKKLQIKKLLGPLYCQELN